mmetsp:Transcript_12697/g.21887  ORF Transcript_12697/g.21887 Transcript_12697/m.21887 type:complete len:211 (+) Transcript_12697:585-1217(+)
MTSTLLLSTTISRRCWRLTRMRRVQRPQTCALTGSPTSNISRTLPLLLMFVTYSIPSTSAPKSTITNFSFTNVIFPSAVSPVCKAPKGFGFPLPPFLTFLSFRRFTFIFAVCPACAAESAWPSAACAAGAPSSAAPELLDASDSRSFSISSFRAKGISDKSVEGSDGISNAGFGYAALEPDVAEASGSTGNAASTTAAATESATGSWPWS